MNVASGSASDNFVSSSRSHRRPGEEADYRMVTKRRSSAHLPVAGLQPRGEPGAAVCMWPFTGNHSRPSPRLPPSPFIGTHVADGNHGALVTTPVDVNARPTAARAR